MLQQIRAGAERIVTTDSCTGAAEPLLRRVRSEFIEMPGMCLTVAQAARLWNLDARTAQLMLGALVDAGFLSRTDGGRFVMARWTTR